MTKRNRQTGFTLIELMILLVILGIFVVLAIGAIDQVKRHPKTNTGNALVYDPRFTDTMPIVNDAIMLMLAQHQLEDQDRHGINSREAWDQLEVVRDRLTRRIEDDGLQKYRKFIIADDSTSRVVLLYPECRVEREPR